MRRAGNVNDAMMLDEVGIAYGRYGPFVLKTLYQPIFRTGGTGLVPCGVEGLVKPFVAGTAVPALSFLSQIPEEDSLFIESVCRALHLANYSNIGVEGLQLFFNFDPHVHSDLDAALDRIRRTAEQLDELALDPDLLVCEITETEALDADALRRLAAEMRGHGIRLAIDDFGVGHSTLERVELIEPDIVKLDGAWFRRIAEEPSAVQLLCSLVAGLQRGGAHVLVEGIQSAEQLRVALDTGSDLLQGYLLARPALAGTIFDTTPRDTEPLLNNPDNVIRLVRGERTRGFG